LGTGRSKHHA